MAVLLHERGAFTWPEWSARLADEIAAATARGEDDDGRRYYRHWLAALEKLVAEKGLSRDDELRARHELGRGRPDDAARQADRPARALTASRGGSPRWDT